MITATFCILLKVNSLSIFFDRMISSLNFTPNKMDVYYNEFLPQNFLSNITHNYLIYYLKQKLTEESLLLVYMIVNIQMKELPHSFGQKS